MKNSLCFALWMGCCLALAPAVAGQEHSADELLEAARQLYVEEGPQPALPEFERVLALYTAVGDRRGEAITLGYIGNCHKRLGDFSRALDYLNRALQMKQELGDRLEEGKTLSHLGLVYWEMGSYQEAIEHLIRAIARARDLGDRQLEGSALNNLSLVYDEQGDYHRSLEQYHRVLDLYRGTGFARGESDTLGNIGGVYLLLGHYRKAMHYYGQAYAISERLDLKPSMSQDLGNLALCYLGLGEVTEALGHFERALVLAKETGLAKEEADWRIGKGKALVTIGKYDPALQEFRQAISVYEKAGLQRETIEAHNELGSLYLLLGDADSSETSFRRAIEKARAIGHARGLTFNLIALGDLEWRRQRFEQSAALYREALALARGSDDRAHTSLALTQLAFTHRDQQRLEEALAAAREAVEVARAIEARPLQAQAHYAHGEVLRVWGRPADALQQFTAADQIVPFTNDPELGWRLAYARGLALEALQRDEDAVVALRAAVEIIESVRGQLREERFRAGYIENKYQVYVDLVRLLLKLNRVDDAFFFAEKLRARSYLDLLNRGQSGLSSEGRRQAEAELRQRIRQLQRAIEQEAARPAPEKRGQALEVFLAELAAAERDYQNLVDDIRSDDPGYAAVRSLDVPSAYQVQRYLPLGAALIEYVVSEDAIAVFVVTRDRVRARSVAIRRGDLHTRVELLRELLTREKSSDWRRPAASLAKLLLEPVERQEWLTDISQLYLVPHDILHYLPFAVLIRERPQGQRFLVEDYHLSYLPSAAALVHANSNDNLAQNDLLALAPARSRLRFAPQEAREVTRSFSNESRALLGRQATETAFKREAGSYRILHFATHGVFNKLNPLLSGLELEPDAHEDGRLEVHEILALRLNAELATLSACDTALASGYFTDVPTGDDFVGLTRAFLFAGTPAVLATLWEVNDRSALELMTTFYRELRKSGKSTALAAAQRAMLASKRRYRHPYFWSAFVLVGQ